MNWKVNLSVVIFGIIFCRIFLWRTESEENSVLASMKESGYEGEQHYVTTEDGYILGVHRIMKSPNNFFEISNNQNDKENNTKKYPVLFVHGLESSALDWINYLGNQSLPYLLFEKGYDVWLGNVRGTPSSFNHTSLDPEKDAQKFWNSSFHEIGYYDLPAMIDHVLKESNSEKLFYIGMSQGEATFLILTSTRPQYNSKIQLAFLTSPSSHLNHSDNVFFKSLAKVSPVLQSCPAVESIVGERCRILMSNCGSRSTASISRRGLYLRIIGQPGVISHPLADTFGVYELPGRNLLGSFCQYKFLSRVCMILSHSMIGYANDDQLELETNTKVFQVYPTRSALKQLWQYLQMYKSGIFRRFDYGKIDNLKMYGSVDPPEYDLRKVTARVAYIWGENDCWSRPKDIAQIEKKLPNLVLSYKVPHKLFNHYDIMVAKDAKKLAYDIMIDTIVKYSL